MKKILIAGTISMINLVLIGSLLSQVIHKSTINPSSNNSHQHGTVNKTIVRNILSQLEKRSSSSEKYRWEIADIYQRKGKMEKPASHCLIDPAFASTDDLAVLRWKCDGSTSYNGRNLLHHDGSLSVTIGGYYFVYSQVLYHGEGTEELDYGRIIHSVLKQKASEVNEFPTILMQNLQSTPTIRRGRQAYTTSSLGATFYLEANSRISVKSSIPRNIATSESPYSTYFGVFLV